MRAAYYLKATYNSPSSPSSNGDSSVRSDVLAALLDQLGNKSHGKLLRHEIAYVLGQLRDGDALPKLAAVLRDGEDDCIARHECAEAIGAIVGSSLSSAGHTEKETAAIAALTLCSAPSSTTPPEVSDTCLIALSYIAWKSSPSSSSSSTAPMACACMLSPYDSSDPAPPHPDHEGRDHGEIGVMMRDETAPLFERYRCMFSLRNKGGERAAVELGRALVTDESSALFRHEVAFVLGQLQHVAGLEYLQSSLEREGEHEFVRHESAEAIGAIDGDWERCEEVLRLFLEDGDLVVRQSCEVALDAMDYFGVLAGAGGEAGEGGEGGETFAALKGDGTVKRDSTVTSHFNIKSKGEGVAA